MTSLRACLLLALVVTGVSDDAAAQPKYEVLKAFGSFDGLEPSSRLIEGSDGAFYGTAPFGGSRGGFGTVFRVSADGTDFSVLHSFGNDDGARPSAGLVEGSDGFLYGTTSHGGLHEFYGTVYKIAADGSAFSVLHHFDGTNGSGGVELIQLPDGALYGTTTGGGSSDMGTVFRVATDGSAFSIIHHFDFSAGSPFARLALGADSSLYGTTSSGAIFRLLPDGSAFSVLRQLNGQIFSSLVQGTDNAFYGTTSNGGMFGQGSVFKMSADGTMLDVLHSFDGSQGSFPAADVVLGLDGALYGSTQLGGASNVGTLFRISVDGSGFEMLRAFDDSGGPAEPLAALHQGPDGAFYGTSRYGGRAGAGTIFRLAADLTSVAVVYSFDNDGLNPGVGLVQGSDGALYGTTYSGGAVESGASGGSGAVFKISRDGSGFSVLHALTQMEGTNPSSTMVQGSDETFYGTTSDGGPFFAGSIFGISADGSSFSLLRPSHGSTNAGLIFGADGALYGTTTSGFLNDMAFRISTDGTDFSVLHEFNQDADGRRPSGLVQGSDGAFYGTTSDGPIGATGAVFRLSPDQSNYSLLHRFEGADLASPLGARLVKGAGGFFYGTALGVGTFGRSTVFRISEDGTSFTVLHEFDPADGTLPYGLTFGSDGNLYGTTADGGTFGHGTLFRVSTKGTGFSVLHNFDGQNGGRPVAAPLEGSDGALYGTTADGGPGGYGVVYRFVHRSSGESVVQFLQPVFTFSEAGRTALLQVKRSGSRSQRTTVDYETSDGTATAGLDYTAATGQLTFAPGVATLTLKVTLIGDTTFEEPESFLARLSNPIGLGAKLGTQHTAVATINDNDGPAFQFERLSYLVRESDAVANVTVRRYGPSMGTANIDVSTVDDTAIAPDDYTTTTVPLTFGPGVLTQTVSVPIVGDSLPESAESLRLQLSNPQQAILGTRATLALNITDDDQGLGFTAGSFTVGERAGRALITVRRTGGASGTLTVDYATSDGGATANADYTASTGQLVFGPGVITRTLAVPVHDDTLDEGSESLLLTLLNPSPPTALGTHSSAVLTILDNEPVVQFSALRYFVSEPAGGGIRQAMITVIRKGRLGGTVHVDYATSPATATAGEDYRHVEGRLTFGPGVVRQRFAVPILGNSIDQRDRALNLMLLGVDVSLGTPDDAVLSIRDNDTAGMAQFDAQVFIVHSSADSALIKITRSGGTAGPVSVAFETRDGTAAAGADYSATSGTVTFGPGETSKSFTVDVFPSGEANEFFTVALGATTGNLRLGPRVESRVWLVH